MVRANAVESRSHSRLRDHLTRIGKKPIDLSGLGKMALELVKYRRDDFEINTANTEIVAHELLLKIKLAILSEIGNA